MIKTETIMVNSIQCIRTYSTTCLIERNGVQYSEAIDPSNRGRIYSETDQLFSDGDIPGEELLYTIE